MNEENVQEIQMQEIQGTSTQADISPEAKAYTEYLTEVYDFWLSIVQDEDVKMTYRLKASDLFNRAVKQGIEQDKKQADYSKEVSPNPYASLPIDELCKLAKHIA